MPYTHLPNGLEVMGVPTLGGGGIPITFGDYYFVDGLNGSDGNTGKAMDEAFQTVAAGYAAMTTNQDDVLLIRGNSSSYNLTAMLTVAKSRCHFVGLDGAARQYGQGVKISSSLSTGATNIATMLNTGTRNTFSNIKFLNGNTVTEGIYCVAEGGEYTQYDGCEFYKSTDLDQTGAAEFVWNGDSTQMRRCTIGSLADAIGGSSIRRPTVLLSNGIAGSGKVCRDGLIEDTMFWRQCKDTTNLFMYSANAADVERMLLLKRCGFINSLAAGNKPAVCIGLAATLTVGNIVLDPSCFASNITKIATATGILVTGAVPSSGTGIAVNAA